MCLTDKIFLHTHVTFCEYLVFHEFKRNLYIILAKHLEQEGIANREKSRRRGNHVGLVSYAVNETATCDFASVWYD